VQKKSTKAKDIEKEKNPEKKGLTKLVWRMGV